MKIIKRYVAFSKKQQAGILSLLLLIGVLQAIYFFVDFRPRNVSIMNEEAWEAHQHKIDSLKSLKANRSQPKIYPFNPNYLTDYKAYLLGMSTREIDRLLSYRKSGKYVESAAAFQQITQISDSLLAHIQPYFKFPNKKNFKTPVSKDKTTHETNTSIPLSNTPKKDINKITKEELKAIKGIGEVLSGRIIKFRERLGGFLLDEQIYDVYGLSAEVVDRLLQNYTVLYPPKLQKININTASVEALTEVAYLYYKTAISIVNYRDSVGKISSIEELTKVKGISIEKIDRLKLYLEVE